MQLGLVTHNLAAPIYSESPWPVRLAVIRRSVRAMKSSVQFFLFQEVTASTFADLCSEFDEREYHRYFGPHGTWYWRRYLIAEWEPNGNATFVSRAHCGAVRLSSVRLSSDENTAVRCTGHLRDGTSFDVMNVHLDAEDASDLKRLGPLRGGRVDSMGLVPSWLSPLAFIRVSSFGC